MLTAAQLRELHASPPAPEPTPAKAKAKAKATPNFQRGSNPEGVVTTIRPASKPMIALVRNLLAERVGNVDAEVVRTKLNEWQTKGGLTFASVSWAIDTLKAIPANEPERPVNKGFRPRPNKFAGDCAECGRKVEGGEGLLLGKDDHGDWAVSHKPGECQPSDFPFPFGSYALMDDDVVKFYVARPDTDEAQGGLFAQASDDLFPIRNAEHRQQIIDRIAADPQAAAALYGQKIGVCGRCGRTLTSKWAEVGIGPVCIKKAW